LWQRTSHPHLSIHLPAFSYLLQRAQISIRMSQAAKSSRYMMHPVMLGF
jgi:hypothetical protein